MQYNLMTPCKECPYTPKTKGWIGDYDSALVFHDFVRGDVRMPCHLTQNHGDRQQHCAGYALYMNEMCKVSQDPQMADFQKRIKMVEQKDEVLFSFDGSQLIDFHGV